MKRILATMLFISGCQNGPTGATELDAIRDAGDGAGVGAILGHDASSPKTISPVRGIVETTDLDDDSTAPEISAEDRLLMDELRAKGVDVRYSDRGVVINLPDVLFDFARSSLTDKARFTIKEIAEILTQAQSRHISVEGHTDSLGTIEHNYHLSDARARAVADELASNGIPARRISIQALGETDPLSSNRTEEGRRANRRVEIVILPPR